MPWLPPDPVRDMARLGAKNEELARTVRRGKAAGNMRDLADADLAKAQDGEVPVYDATTGKWVPGTAGGAAYALIEDVTGASANNNNSTRVLYDSIVESSGSHGLTPHPSIAGIWTLADGIYTVIANVLFAANGTGLREAQITGDVAVAALTYPPAVTVPAVTDGSEPTNLTTSAIVRSASGANELYVYGRQTSGGSLTIVGRNLTILRHA